MRNYALMTTAITLVLGVMLMNGSAYAQDALAGTLPSPSTASATPIAASASDAAIAPASAPLTVAPASTAPVSTTTASGGQVFVPDAGGTATGSVGSASPVSPSTTTTTLPSSAPSSPSTSAIVPMPSSSATLGTPGSPLGATANGLITSPATPQIVQDAVTRLQKTDQINLDDMIRAQDAINRLDLLLEIEKRQSELKKIRDERNKPVATAASALLGSAIPASALNLPKMPSAPLAGPDSASSSSAPSFTPKPSPPKSSSGPSEKYSIQRISGSDGRYFAVINTDEGAETVRSGDKLSDGSVVKSITLTSVSLIKEKKSKTLTIPTESYIVRESGTPAE